MAEIDSEAVERLIREAGRDILLPAFSARQAAGIKEDGSSITAADLACQQRLRDGLQTIAPDVGFLGEEMAEAEQLACLRGGGNYWCVDPLDGTSNFAAHLPLFAISVALIEAGRPAAAWVFDPVRDEMFAAGKGRGATLNGKPLAASAAGELKEAVGYIDFKRLPPPLAAKLATERIYRSQRNLGSCALEWAWLAAGRGRFIVHGGEKLWDFAAGSLLAGEAGCIAGDFDGRPLFAGERLVCPVLAAADRPLHEALIRHIGDR